MNVILLDVYPLPFFARGQSHGVDQLNRMASVSSTDRKSDGPESPCRTAARPVFLRNASIASRLQVG